MSSITPEFLKQKAREISYALNRVSFYIKRQDLRERLERLSFEFLENVAVGSEDILDKQAFTRVFKSLSVLDVLIRMGHSLYEIEPVNANILIRELDSFNSAIRQFGNVSENLAGVRQFGNAFPDELPNLESVFSMPPAVIVNQPDSANDLAVKEKEIVEKAYGFGNIGTLPNVIVRQELIADKIRQLGRVNLKDIAVRFPNVSERTLRYDLQRLCDQGTIEKVGNTGPGTGYIAKIGVGIIGSEIGVQKAGKTA